MRFFRIFTISLLIHLALAYLISFVPQSDLSRLKTKRPAYVELLETPELRRRPQQAPLNEKTFVRNAPAPRELLTNEKKKKRFASQDDQTVIEEQKAQASGMTENRASESLALKQRPARKTARGKSGDLDFTPESALERAKREILSGDSLSKNGDIRVGGLRGKPHVSEPASQPLALPSFNDFARGISTLGSDLPDDIKYGSFTALNTDRHLYYSFYSRIEEAIRHRWETYVRAAIFEVETGTSKIQMKDRFVTRLEIILDERGNFEKAIMSEGSGVRSFDSAPVQAFRDAQKFPHPPAEMVKDDGKIHIYYAFTIDVAPRYASRGSSSL